VAEVIESAAFTDEDWEDLFYYIKNKNTTPFLGSGISRQHFGTGKDLADKIATEFGYPFNDDYDLAKVAQFATIRKKGDSFRVRTFVADYIKNKKLPDFHDPSEPHMILSKLNLPIYITTNYDHLMYEALKSDGKKPVIEFCRWNDLAQIQGKSSIFDQFNEFDPYNPVVYHIHGEIDNPQSMVLTEDDYLNFIVKLYVDIDKLFPAQIRLRFASSSIMFIGYSLSDWNLRIILRKMAYSMKSTSTTHCSIQLIPTDVKPGYENKIKDDLKSYFQIIQGVNLNIFWGTAIDFCHTLSEKAKIKM
jgi:hypothetical protein